MKKVYNNRRISAHLFITLILSALIHSGCKKLIEVDLPIDKNTAKTVYSNTNTAVAVLNGIYIRLSQFSFIAGVGGVSVISGLMADELVDNSGQRGAYTNAYNSDGTGFWQEMYSKHIFSVNSVIEGVSASSGIPDGSKQVLLGEAKVLRALIYFNLVNLYGDVPLVLTTDFKTNSNIPRSPKSVIYEQIIKDLKEAQGGLTDRYLGLDLNSGTEERVRPNKAAATALLARTYLYMGRWSEAEAEASKIIDNVAIYALPTLEQVFLTNSKEVIWQLQTIDDPDEGDGLTLAGDARYFIPLHGERPDVSVSAFVLDAFETGDNRKTSWIRSVSSGADNYLIPNKYKAGRDGFVTNPEYNMVFRLAEQYLIRAEARAQQNKITGANSAESDLNAIRARAGLTGTTASNRTTMLDAILRERRVELFTEWGHRWFDLKRIGKIDEVMNTVTPIKGGTWAPYKALLPILREEFQLNPALRGHQNPGYPESFD